MRHWPHVKCLAVLVLLWLVAGTVSAVAQQTSGSFTSRAPRVLLIEETTGTVLLAKGEDEVFAPASLAKLMTLEVVFDALRRGEITLDTSYVVTEHAWRTGGAPSRTATMFAALKSSIRVEDLVKGVIVHMANDGCIILAEGMAGTEQAFAKRMTERAAALGLSASTFANATGLPDPGNRTTLSDMVRLARHLKETYPEYYGLFTQPDFEWNKIRQRNKNPLLALDVGAEGLSTGFAEGSGFSIVASAEKQGVSLLLAMGGLASDKERTEEAARALRWAQTAFERKRLFAAGEVIGSASVYGGATGTVELKTMTPVEVFVATDEPERLDGRIVYHWPLSAPVEEGRQVGDLRVFAGDRLLREIPLHTAAAIEQGTLRQRATDALIEMLFFWL